MPDNITHALGITSGAPVARIIKTVRDANELPYRIALTYFDVDLNGAVSVVHSSTTRKGGREVALSLPVFLKRSDAKELADKIMLKAWSERVQYQFSLPITYVIYDPGDVLELQDDETGQAISCRIVESVYDPTGIIHITAVRHDPSVYTFQTNYSDNSGITPASPTYATASFYVAECNMPLYDMEPPAFWVFPVAKQDFRQAELYVSKDGGASWNGEGPITGGTFVGTVQAYVPAGKAAIRDYKNKLVITPDIDCNYTLQSRSMMEVVDGKNQLLVNGEIIRFETATLLGNGDWELSGLYRGSRGTEDKAGLPIDSGAKAMLLDNAIPVYDYRPGQTVEVRMPVTALGEAVDSVPGQLLNIEGVSWKALPLCRIRAEWLSSTQVKISWAHRNRYLRDWNGYNDEPEDADFESYELRVSGYNGTPSTRSDHHMILNVGNELPSGPSTWTITLFQSTHKIKTGRQRYFTLTLGENLFIKD